MIKTRFLFLAYGLLLGCSSKYQPLNTPNLNPEHVERYEQCTVLTPSPTVGNQNIVLPRLTRVYQSESRFQADLYTSKSTRLIFSSPPLLSDSLVTYSENHHWSYATLIAQSNKTTVFTIAAHYDAAKPIGFMLQCPTALKYPSQEIMLKSGNYIIDNKQQPVMFDKAVFLSNGQGS